MKVLIVAKTRQGNGACVGGITFEGRSVRLIPAQGDTHEGANRDYAVGEVWEIEATTPEQFVAPHVENIVVQAQRRMGPMSSPARFIERHMPPHAGGPEALYEGLAQSGESGVLYITERGGVPSFSTMFWRPDQPLTLVQGGKRLRYRYPTADGGRTLVFVGFQEPVAEIPAGALVRVSLGHWWRPDDRPQEEKRCYVQLSGYFLDAIVPPVSVASEADVRSAPRAEPAAAPAVSAQHLLKTVFGYDSFWPLQAEIIANVLARRDTLAVMPTGGGKSLCYQLPALIFDGLTLVVSPLIALMQDQVDQLRALGVPAALLNSTVDYHSYVETMSAVRQGHVKLLYTSPETLQRPELQVLLDESRLACLTIDEAHCISQWGHDFRPEYRQLLPVRRRYAQAVCLAFTATATARVRQDIAQQLGLAAADTFVASFNRTNLYLAARSRTDGLDQVRAFLQRHRDQSGIIYCNTRDKVDRLAEMLAAEGWPALPYHAGLDDAVRRQNQRRFIHADSAIMVATIAFGMGINKPNVRFVVHYNLPKELESYYQEIGRAGRDGLPAECLLLFGAQDATTAQYFISQGAVSQQAGATARLQAMLRYAQTSACRRVPLLDYFGETFAEASCDACDNCRRAQTGDETLDLTEPARKFLRCVQETGQLFGVSHIANVLRGSQAQKVGQHRHNRLPSYGSGREYPDKQWRQWGQQFIAAGLLEQDMEHGSLRLSASGREVLAGTRPVLVAAPRELLPSTPAEPEHDSGLYEALRTLRRQLADAANVPPYVIFPDRTLLEMAIYFPQTTPRLMEINGVGETKLQRYGAAFLAVLCEYCAAHGLAERPKAAHAPATLTGDLSKRRFVEVGELFASGLSVAEIQAHFGVQRGTVMKHLADFQRQGGAVDGERVRALSTLTPAQQAQVIAVFDDLGSDALTPVFQALDGVIPYEELHLMRVVYLSR